MAIFYFRIIKVYKGFNTCEKNTIVTERISIQLMHIRRSKKYPLLLFRHWGGNPRVIPSGNAGKALVNTA